MYRGFHPSLEPASQLRDEEIYAHFGLSDEGVVRSLAPAQYDKGIAEYLRHYADLHDQKCPHPFEGIVETLEYLRDRGVILAMVTGKGMDSAKISLGKFGLEGYFRHVIAGSPNSRGKGPGIAALLRRFDIMPKEAAYLGDVPSDVSASREAGVVAYSAAWAGTADYDALAGMNPDEIFRTVGEFADHLRTIFPEDA